MTHPKHFPKDKETLTKDWLLGWLCGYHYCYMLVDSIPYLQTLDRESLYKMYYALRKVSQ